MKSVCIIGAGVAGITCADILSSNGFQATIFEQSDKIGGVINLIPDERFNKKIIKTWQSKLDNQNVKIVLNQNINLNSLDSLDFDIIIIATGTQKCRFIDNIDGICAIEFLQTTCNPNQKIAVIGGGNVALDCACHAARNNCATTIYYRKEEENLRASKHEIKLAKSFGVKFVFSFTEYESIIADQIVMAIGTEPDLPDNIESNRIFVIGDAKTGASSISNAMNNARQMANELCRCYSSNSHEQ